MFRKIVSNLSLSPSAGSQLTYYLRRLQKEGVTRKLSLVFAGGLVILQIATMVSPSSASNQPSTNDIVYGGLGANPKAAMLNIYDQNHDSYGHTGFQNLYKYFGITRANIEASSVGNINSSDPNTLYSLGRTHPFANDLQLTIDGQNYYYRPLANWGANLTYPALVGHRDDGSFFAILVDCGNIVVRTIPIKPPKLQLTKAILPGYPAAGTLVRPGAILGFQLFFKNSGGGAAHHMVIEDPIPKNTTLKWLGDGTPFEGDDSNPIPKVGAVKHVWWAQEQVSAGYGSYTGFSVKVNDNVPNNTQICNVAYIRSDEISIQKSNQICYTVYKQAPPPPPPPPPPTNPKINLTKSVKNLTKNISNANNTTAGAGDVLEYTLATKNSGNGPQKDYQVNEDLTDVLAYATVIKTGGGTLSNGHLVWPKVTIAAGATLTKTFQIKIANPIPATGSTMANPKLNDCQIDNAYGKSAVSVKLTCPAPKQIETTVEKLPQTGTGTTTTFTFVLIAAMIFFYLRNRQLVRELKMLRVDNVTG